MSKSIPEKIIDGLSHTLMFIIIMPIVTIRRPETMYHPIESYKNILSENNPLSTRKISQNNDSKKKKPHDWDKAPRKIYKIKRNQNKRIQRPKIPNIRSQIRK